MFERTFRRSCTACNGPIVWLTAEQARKDGELAKDLAEAAKWMGEPIQSVWQCKRSTCGEAGFFGSRHSG